MNGCVRFKVRAALRISTLVTWGCQKDGNIIIIWIVAFKPSIDLA